MKKQHCHYLGKILKTHGFKGDVRVAVDDIFSAELKKMESVFFEIDKILVPFFVQSCFLQKDDVVIIHFDGIDTREKATEFINTAIYIPRENISSVNDEDESYPDIIGYEVSDLKLGKLGIIENYLEIPDNPLFVVKNNNGESKLYPMVDEFIVGIDQDKRTLMMNLPHGFDDI